MIDCLEEQRGEERHIKMMKDEIVVLKPDTGFFLHASVTNTFNQTLLRYTTVSRPTPPLFYLTSILTLHKYKYLTCFFLSKFFNY